MKNSQVIPALAVLVALLAAGYAGAWGYREKQTNEQLQDVLRTQAEESSQAIAQIERQIQALETQLALAKRNWAAANVRADQRETELAATTEKSAEIQKLNAQVNNRLEFEIQQSRLAHYETAEQLLGLPACVLKDAENHACVEAFKDSAGNPFYIGGPGAHAEVAAFIQSLENGKTYSLPADFIEFQKKQKQAGAAVAPEPPSAPKPVERVQQTPRPEKATGDRF
jgi:outer membrane murein-binding lipoprotein Lpp